MSLAGPYEETCRLGLLAASDPHHSGEKAIGETTHDAPSEGVHKHPHAPTSALSPPRRLGFFGGLRATVCITLVIQQWACRLVATQIGGWTFSAGARLTTTTACQPSNHRSSISPLYHGQTPPPRAAPHGASPPLRNPDVGYRARALLVGGCVVPSSSPILTAHLLFITQAFASTVTSGYTNTLGVYQDADTREGTASSSNISWIGYKLLFLRLAVGLLAGVLLDKGCY